jgi:hypothetical protein
VLTPSRRGAGGTLKRSIQRKKTFGGFGSAWVNIAEIYEAKYRDLRHKSFCTQRVVTPNR